MPTASRHPLVFKVMLNSSALIGSEITFSSSLPTYSWRLVPGEHSPGVPAHVLSEGGVLPLSKPVDVLGCQAGGNLDEHVTEGEGGQG